jgi:ElaB/YqjD/DUF883 family membrane-anchored ribosome-binding protein
MADLAETDRASSVRRRENGRATRNNDDLEDQIGRLRDDLKAIAASIARLSERKAADVKDEAEASVSQLIKTGQQAIDEVSTQASALEGDLKRLVREKPLTAIATALGVGFILAVLARH